MVNPNNPAADQNQSAPKQNEPDATGKVNLGSNPKEKYEESVELDEIKDSGDAGDDVEGGREKKTVRVQVH